MSLPWRIGIAGLVSGIAIALLPAAFRDHAGLREILLVGSANWPFAAIALLVQFTLKMAVAIAPLARLMKK